MLLRLAILLCSLTLARASAATLQDCSSLRPTHLTIEYEDAQQPQEVGALPATIIDIPNPRFSWRLETANATSKQSMLKRLLEEALGDVLFLQETGGISYGLILTIAAQMVIVDFPSFLVFECRPLYRSAS